MRIPSSTKNVGLELGIQEFLALAMGFSATRKSLNSELEKNDLITWHFFCLLKAQDFKTFTFSD